MHGLVRQIDAPIHCVTFFPSFTLRILFLQINYLPEFLLCNTQARNMQSAAYLCLCPRSGNVYRLVFFSFFCSDKNRKLDLDFQVVCQNRQKLEMTFATKCINKKEFSEEFQYIQVKATKKACTVICMRRMLICIITPRPLTEPR